MSDRGEYEHVGLDRQYSGPARELLSVSAFGGVGPTEDQLACELFGTADTTRHPILGHHTGLYAGFATEGKYRQLGSSGGITTWLLAELLRSGRVDGVIHMRPSREQLPLFEYGVSTTAEEVLGGAKSRYYPGQLADVLGSIAQTGGRYAVTAIPSFAYEIRLLQRLRPEYKELIPYVIGLICGHQKTANYASFLAWRAGIDPAELIDIDFRVKVEGRPANRYSTKLTSVDASGERHTRTLAQSDLKGTDWGLGLFKSNFSDFTEDAFNETADIVFGDAWLPEYTTDSSGTNVVIARSAELDEILKQASHEHRLNLEQVTEDAVLRSQSALVKQNVYELPTRFAHIERSGGYTPAPRRRETARVSRSRRQIQEVRYHLSTQSHAAWSLARLGGDLGQFDATLEPLLTRYERLQRRSRQWLYVKQLPRRVVRKFGILVGKSKLHANRTTR